MDEKLNPRIIATIQARGVRINFYPYLHFIITKSGTDKEAKFRKFTKVENFRYM